MARTLLDGNADLAGARIAYLIPPGADYIIAQWGIWLAGGVAVPLSLSATERELEYTLTDALVAAVVTSEPPEPSLQPLIDRLGLRAHSVAGREEGSTSPLPAVDASRPAMILYTSGTTSKPKGVVTTHECIRAQIESLIEAWCWQADDRIPLFLPLHHIHGIINILSCALWTGARAGHVFTI